MDTDVHIHVVIAEVSCFDCMFGVTVAVLLHPSCLGKLVETIQLSEVEGNEMYPCNIYYKALQQNNL